jgi:hypothetical protein
MWSKKSVTKMTKGEEQNFEELEDEMVEFLDESDAKGKGLWHNIREKKKREGKNYKPAKPGDKDYPDEKSLKKAQGPKKKKAKAEDDKDKGKKESGLTDQQKKLPDAIKKTILEKKKKSKADDKAGYPPKCKPGYAEKDGKCVPVSDSGYKNKKKYKK